MTEDQKTDEHRLRNGLQWLVLAVDSLQEDLTKEEHRELQQWADKIESRLGPLSLGNSKDGWPDASGEFIKSLK